MNTRFLVCIVLMGCQILCYSQYKWINPKPQGNDLNSVYFVNENTGYAVGDYGTVIKSVDGGMNWTCIQTNTARNLNGVFFLNENYGFAVGDSGIIIRTEDHGVNWTTSVSGLPTHLYSVYFTDDSTGYSCGTNGIILKTTDGGIQWNEIASFPSTNLFSIDFPSTSVGYIVGGGGYMGWNGLVLKSSDGGNNWVLLTDSFADTFYSTDFIDSLTGYAVGNRGLVAKTVDGGNNWTTLNLSSGFNHAHSVCFINSQTGFTCDGIGNIAKTNDAGQTWNTVYQSKWNRLNSISKINDSSVCIAGAGGLIISSHDYGTSFNNITTSPIGNLVSIDKTDDKNIFVTGDNVLFKSDDGGGNWNTHILPSLSGCVSAQFLNSTTGYALTNKIYNYQVKRTEDSGLTWSSFTLPQSSYQLLNDFTMVNKSLGFIVGGGKNPIATLTWGNLFKTTDGINWIEIIGSWPYFNSVYFKNDSIGFLLGGLGKGKLYKTTDAGNTWNLVPFDFPTSLAKMIFVNENTGFIAGSDMLLKTTDGGLNWDVIYTSYDCNGSFDFTDSLNLYFVGLNGLILSTNDGGTSWIVKKGFTTNNLNAILLENDTSGFIIGHYGNFVSFGSAGSAGVHEFDPGFYLSVNSYPNPFIETIKFELYSNTTDEVSISLFDFRGRQIAEMKKSISKGNQVVEFNPGVNLDQGIYLYRIKGNKLLNTGIIIKR